MYTYREILNDTEKNQALELIKRVYKKQGYIGDDESSFNKYILSQSSKMFGGYANEELFATISIVNDSEIGLPMDLLYKEELAPLRNGKISEVTQFAVDHEVLKKMKPEISQGELMTSSIPLLSKVLKYAVQENIDNLCITINPKHDAFYKSLGFVEFGGLKDYPSVSNAPAKAFALDVNLSLKKKDLPPFIRKIMESDQVI